MRRAREVGAVRVRPIGAITHGLEGKALADIAEMKDAGIVAISDDGRPVMNAGPRCAARSSTRKTFDLPLVQHAEDLDLAEGGAMNEGAVATRIGIKGQPACAESAMVARDLEIVEWTGARYHVAHVSTARTVALVRDAKRRGLPVTCEVTPHHLALTDEACSHYDTRTKVMPPLRTAADQEALLEALADGTIDCDRDRPRAALAGREGRRVRVRGARHARPRDRAADHPRLRAHGLARRQARDRGADRRRRRARSGLPGGSLAVGAVADICVIDPERPFTLDRRRRSRASRRTRRSSARSSPGRAVLTLVEGRVVYDLDGRFAVTSQRWPAALVLENGKRVPRRGLRRARRVDRRGRVQHVDHRLPGDRQRPVVLPGRSS